MTSRRTAERTYRVTPGERVRLGQRDPADASLFDDDGGELLGRLSRRIDELEQLLCAVRKQSLLVVLQGMDASGKDEVIRSVFDHVDASRLHVSPFDEPTADEAAHDFLWRVHAHAPGCGEIAIFDRSHYEGVLVDRVHANVPPRAWRRRYDEINAFEETLANHDTVIVKFFLHMSKEEQRRRLEERLEDPATAWKFKESDLRERKLWTRYMRAYEEAIEKTARPRAPWFIIPADVRWHRDLAVASIIVDTLETLKLRYPKPSVDARKVRIR